MMLSTPKMFTNKIIKTIKMIKDTKEISDVSNSERMGKFKIQVKLIGVFLIPVLFIILLGISCTVIISMARIFIIK